MPQINGYDVAPIDESTTQQKISGYDVAPLDSAKNTVTQPEYAPAQETGKGRILPGASRAIFAAAEPSLNMGSNLARLGSKVLSNTPLAGLAPIAEMAAEKFGQGAKTINEAARASEQSAVPSDAMWENVGGNLAGQVLPFKVAGAVAEAGTQAIKGIPAIESLIAASPRLGRIGELAANQLGTYTGGGALAAPVGHQAEVAKTSGEFGAATLPAALIPWWPARAAASAYSAYKMAQHQGADPTQSKIIGGISAMFPPGSAWGKTSDLPSRRVGPDVPIESIQLPQRPQFDPEYVQRTEITHDPNIPVTGFSKKNGGAAIGGRTRNNVMVEQMPLDQATGGYSGAQPYDEQLGNKNINLAQASQQGGLSPDVAGIGMLGTGQGYPGEQANLIGMAQPYRPSFPPQFDPTGGSSIGRALPEASGEPYTGRGGSIPPSMDPTGGSSLGIPLPEPTEPYTGTGGGTIRDNLGGFSLGRAIPEPLPGIPPPRPAGGISDLQTAAAAQQEAAAPPLASENQPKSNSIQKGVPSDVEIQQVIERERQGLEQARSRDQNAEGKRLGQEPSGPSPETTNDERLLNPATTERGPSSGPLVGREVGPQVRPSVNENLPSPTQADMPEGIVPAGEMTGMKGDVVKLYNSEKTGQTFAVREGETLPDVMERTAKEQASKPTQGEINEQGVQPQGDQITPARRPPEMHLTEDQVKSGELQRAVDRHGDFNIQLRWNWGGGTQIMRASDFLKHQDSIWSAAKERGGLSNQDSDTLRDATVNDGVLNAEPLVPQPVAGDEADWQPVKTDKTGNPTELRKGNATIKGDKLKGYKASFEGESSLNPPTSLKQKMAWADQRLKLKSPSIEFKPPINIQSQAELDKIMPSSAPIARNVTKARANEIALETKGVVVPDPDHPKKFKVVKRGPGTQLGTGLGGIDPEQFKAGGKKIKETAKKVGRLLFEREGAPAYEPRTDIKTPPQVKEAIDSVIASKKKPLRANKGVETERKTPISGKLKLAHAVPENVIMQLDDNYQGKGILHKTAIAPMEKGSEGVHRDSRAAMMALKDALEKSGRTWGSEKLLGTSRVAFGDKEATAVPLKLSGGEIKATPAEWLSAAAHLGDQQTADQVLRGRKINWDRDKNATPFTIKPGDIRTISNWVKENGWQPVVDAMKSHIEGNRQRLFDVVKKLRGDVLTPYKGYWSRRINRAQQIDEANLPDAKAVIDRKLENMNFLKSRDENAQAPILFGDAFQEYLKHTHDAAMVMNMADPVANATAFLSHPSLVQAIERHYGADMLDYLKTYLKGAIGGRGEATTGFDKFQNAITKNFARAQLMANPSPWLKQIGGILKLTAEIPYKHWVSGLKDAMSPKIYKEMTDASATLWDRHEGNFAHLASPMLGEAGPTLGEMTLKDAVKRFGRGVARGDIKQAYGSTLQMVDKLKAMNYFDSMVSRTAWSARKQQVNAEHPDWTPEQKKDWMVETVNRDISRTQNTGDSLHMSGFSRKNLHSPYARAMLLFSSDNNKNFNMLQRAAHMPAKDAARTVTSIALNTLWSSLVNTARYAGIPLAARALLGGPSDEDMGKQKQDTAAQSMAWNIAKNLAGTVYGGDNAVRIVESMAKQSKEADVNTAPEEVMSQLFTGLSQIGAAMGQDGEFKSGPHKGEGKSQVNAMRGLEQILIGGSGIAGLPIPPAYLMGKKAYQATQFPP